MARPFPAPRPAQFSLFDEEAPAVEATASQPASPASSTEPDTPAVAIASVLSPAMFRHPSANREIRPDEHVVAYALKRARRRTIGFIVGTDGLCVNAPK